MNQPASSRQSFSHGNLNSFKSWLISKSYSPSTIRNYLADINRYLVNTKNNIFSPESVSDYLTNIKKDPNINRYLSSLSKFFQFAIDQHLISINPLKTAQKPKIPSPEDILKDYQSFLSQKHFSPATIKNYLNDIQQFIDWLTQNQVAP
jgi:site-specific recombinase XerD